MKKLHALSTTHCTTRML